MPYVEDLRNILDMEVIRKSGLKIGVDPMGGATLPFWETIRERYNLNMEVVNPVVDPCFGFMTVDKDGKIRMDCSSPPAMAGLTGWPGTSGKNCAKYLWGLNGLWTASSMDLSVSGARKVPVHLF